MTYTLGGAAKAVGKSKATISRAIKSGKLSAEKQDNGTFAIDPSELQRVWPAVSRNGDGNGAVKRSETPNETVLLERDLDNLRQRLADRDREMDDVRQDRDRWRDQATALLTDQRKPSRWLARLLGR